MLLIGMFIGSILWLSLQAWQSIGTHLVQENRTFVLTQGFVRPVFLSVALKFLAPVFWYSNPFVCSARAISQGVP